MSKRFPDGTIFPYSSTIKRVMRGIDTTGLRSAHVTDASGKLLGVVSDSEIRKSILKGVDINSPVESIINRDPIILTEDELENPGKVASRVRRLAKRMPDLTRILVVDKSRRPVRFMATSLLTGLSAVKGRRRRHSGKNVLIVGGAGYLGSMLCRKLLALGYSVRALDILMFGKESIEELLGHKRFELMQGDMRNISVLVKALENMDAVVNLAAVVGDPACKNQPEATIETNYLANKALAEAAKYHQINRFIYASTCSVYGAATGSDALDEDAPLNPVSLYARSKIQSEIGIAELEDDNFAPTILRMSTLYGYSRRMRFDLVVNTMTKTALETGAIHVNEGGKQWRPLLHVEDAADAFVRCIQVPLNTIKGAVFNVGSSKQNYQIIDIARAVKRAVPKARLVVHEAASDQRDYKVSFARIERVLGYTVRHDLDRSILRIKKAIESKEVENPNDPKHYNVEVSQ